MNRVRRALRPIAALALLTGLSLTPVVANAAGLGETWISPTTTAFGTPNVSDPSVTSTNDSIAVSGSTGLAVWVKGAGNSAVIQVARSTDGGATWGAPVNVSTGTYGVSGPRVAISGSTAVVVWTEAQPGYSGYRIKAARSADAGATWSAPGDLSATGEMNTPQVALSGSTAVVVWIKLTVVSSAANYTAQVASSTNGGSTWTSAIDVSATTTTSPSPDVAVSGSNAVLTWVGSNGSNVVVWEGHSSNGGATWGSATQRSASGQDAGQPQVALSGSTGVLTWKRFNGSNTIVQAASTADGGANWGAVADLSATGLSASVPQVAMDGSAVVVAWQRSTGSGTNVQALYSGDGGATWGASVTDISGSGTAENELQVALSGSSATAVWTHFDGTRSIVVAASSSNAGEAWAAPATLSPVAYTSETPRVALSSSSAVIAWTKYSTNVGVIQVATGSVASAASSASATVARAQFTFWLEDGRECTSISPQEALVGSTFELPGADAPCGYDGSVVTGWRIPGQSNAFEPGRVVVVVAPQQFTAVLEMPWVQVKYDANVAAADACLSSAAVDTPLDARTSEQWIPRDKVTAQVLPSAAACVPPGHVFAGWSDRGAPTIDRGAVRAAGDAIPAPAIDEDGNAANVIHLYAVWRPADAARR